MLETNKSGAFLFVPNMHLTFNWYFFIRLSPNIALIFIRNSSAIGFYFRSSIHIYIKFYASPAISEAHCSPNSRFCMSYILRLHAFKSYYSLVNVIAAYDNVLIHQYPRYCDKSSTISLEQAKRLRMMLLSLSWHDFVEIDSLKHGTYSWIGLYILQWMPTWELILCSSKQTLFKEQSWDRAENRCLS